MLFGGVCVRLSAYPQQNLRQPGRLSKAGCWRSCLLCAVLWPRPMASCSASSGGLTLEQQQRMLEEARQRAEAAAHTGECPPAFLRLRQLRLWRPAELKGASVPRRLPLRQESGESQPH